MVNERTVSRLRFVLPLLLLLGLGGLFAYSFCEQNRGRILKEGEARSFTNVPGATSVMTGLAVQSDIRYRVQVQYRYNVVKFVAEAKESDVEEWLKQRRALHIARGTNWPQAPDLIQEAAEAFGVPCVWSNGMWLISGQTKDVIDVLVAFDPASGFLAGYAMCAKGAF